MKDVACDVAIIGAGTAGLSARSAVRDAGASSLLIESGPGGTTCARTGCMPSKLLIAAAAAAHGIEAAGVFGVRGGRPAIDGAAVMARLRRERDSFVDSVLDKVASFPDAETLRGHARFTGPSTLVVDDHTAVEAGAIVIATGSRSALPQALAGIADRVLTNETVFELETLPRSLAVIGAGPLGIELAQAFARLGVRTTVFDKGGTIGGSHDPEIAAVAHEILSREVTFRLGTRFQARPGGDGVRLSWHSEDGRSGDETFERVLAAAGRPPNLDDLDLDKAGLDLDEHGVPVFDPETLRCGSSMIFIAGDANHDRPVLHEAANEGRIAGRNAAQPADIQPSARGVALAIVFTHPGMAAVGPSFGTLEAQQVLVGHCDLRQSGRARVEARNAGLIRVYADRTDNRLLGGEMVGPDAEHLAHLLAWAVQLGLTAEEVLALPFYHPTLEESLRTAMRDLCGQAPTTKLMAESLEFGPGA